MVSRSQPSPALRGADTASEPSAAVAMWMIARGYATGHGDTIGDMLGELEAQARERGLWPLTTWRGLCGHVWDRAVEDTAECPRCTAQAVLIEAMAKVDAASASCPVRTSARAYEKCPRCYATDRQNCGPEVAAYGGLEIAVRAVLAPALSAPPARPASGPSRRLDEPILPQPSGEAE